MTPRGKLAAARLPAQFVRLEGIGREIARLKGVPYVGLKRTKVDARAAFAVTLEVEQWIAEDTATLEALRADAERPAVHWIIANRNGTTTIEALPPLSKPAPSIAPVSPGPSIVFVTVSEIAE